MNNPNYVKNVSKLILLGLIHNLVSYVKILLRIALLAMIVIIVLNVKITIFFKIEHFVENVQK